MLAHALMLAVPVIAASTDATPIQLFNGDRDVIVTVTVDVVGPNVRFVADFPKPVKSYLKEQYDNLSVEYHVDADNNAKTGNTDSPDARRGAEFMVIGVARVPRSGVNGQEVIVTRASDHMIVKTNAKIEVAGNRMTVSVPATDMKVKRGQKIRIAVVEEGLIVERTLTL